MISEKYASEQIRRLGQMDFFPKGDKVGIAELVSAAMTAETQLACIKAIDDFVFNETQCPKAADIRRSIANRNEQIERQDRMPKCPDCNGTRFITDTFLVTKHGDEHGATWTDKQKLETEEQIIAVKNYLRKNQEILMGARMCHCHPGNAKTA